MKYTLFIAAAVLTLFSSGCRVDKEPAGYFIPDTYVFNNANYESSTQRLDMLAEMTNYIRTAHSNTVAPVLDAQKLNKMFANAGDPFDSAWLNSSGIQLKDKTSDAFSFISTLENSFISTAVASLNAAAKPTETSASNGIAGKMINGTRYILVDSLGLECKEIAEKGIMGAIFYYQATTLLNNINGYDNETRINGLTAQERAWDEAFGYFGVPTDFPANTNGLKNWGNYCNTVSKQMGGSSTLNETIMQAWIGGRAAVSNKDDANRDQYRNIILQNWEKIIAARFISYVKGAKTNISSPANYHHNLSEAVGFVQALRYNGKKSVSDSDIQILLDYFTTDGTVNLYKVNTANMDLAINKMAALFGLNPGMF